MGHTGVMGGLSEGESFEISLGNLAPGARMTTRAFLGGIVEGDKGCIWFGLPVDFFPRIGGYKIELNAKAKFPSGALKSMIVAHGTQHDVCDSLEFSTSKHPGAEGVFAIELITNDSLGPVALLEKDPNSSSLAGAITFFPEWSHLDKDLITPYVEVVFLVDRSGSMDSGFGPKRGGRIAKARDTLQLFLASLPQNCLFQVIGFGSSFQLLFPQGSVRYSPETLKVAQDHAKNLKADLGGTDLLQPLVNALKKDVDPEFPRHVFVLTDGEVKNRDETIAAVADFRGNSIVHTIGIGSGADTLLCQGVANAGRGLCDMIADNGDMRAIVIRQLQKALEPTLRNVKLELLNCTAKFVVPSQIPAIPEGSRLSIYAMDMELTGAGASVKLTGIAPDEVCD